MRISDWSSDVCSSDLVAVRGRADGEPGMARQGLRTDRLAVADGAPDQRTQQLPDARVEAVLVVDPAGHDLHICPRRPGCKRLRPTGDRPAGVSPPATTTGYQAGRHAAAPWSLPRPHCTIRTHAYPPRHP